MPLYERRPIFRRVDLEIILPDGTRSEKIVIYHDDLLEDVLLEALDDADKVKGTIVIDGVRS
jgi:hypothetical protein